MIIQSIPVITVGQFAQLTNNASAADANAQNATALHQQEPVKAQAGR